MIIIGANSMIGSRFWELTKRSFENEKSLILDTPEINLITDTAESIEKKLGNFENQVLIHFAAFTDVDGAQIQRGNTNGTCWQLNVEGTKKLTEVAKKLNLKMVYISTDFIFDGEDGPYTEEDKVAKSPEYIGWYAWTKLEGEKVIQEEGCKFLIARTSYPYRANFGSKTDFVRNIIERLKNNNLYPVFTDQFLTPTFIDDFAKALNLLIKEGQTGIWHVVDNTVLSAYEAAVEIAKIFGFDQSKIEKESIIKFQAENPKAAIRPVKGGLKNAKLQAFLARHSLSMLNFPQALIEMKKQMEVIT